MDHTPYCVKNCRDKHHKILLAIVNSNEDFSSFINCMKHYISHGWREEQDIPEKSYEFRYPVLHWAAVLGKVKAVKWLIENKFSACCKSDKRGETPLHRIVGFLPGSMQPVYQLSEITATFASLLDHLESSLEVKDDNGDTALVVAAKWIVEKHVNEEYFRSIIEVMVGRIVQIDKSWIFDLQNLEGNTVLHILALTDLCVTTIRLLLENGAQNRIKNEEGERPLDVAMNLGKGEAARELAVDIEQFLRTNRKRSRSLNEIIESLQKNPDVYSQDLSDESAENSPKPQEDSEIQITSLKMAKGPVMPDTSKSLEPKRQCMAPSSSQDLGSCSSDYSNRQCIEKRRDSCDSDDQTPTSSSADFPVIDVDALDSLGLDHLDYFSSPDNQPEVSTASQEGATSFTEGDLFPPVSPMIDCDSIDNEMIDSPLSWLKEGGALQPVSGLINRITSHLNDEMAEAKRQLSDAELKVDEYACDLRLKEKFISNLEEVIRIKNEELKNVQEVIKFKNEEMEKAKSELEVLQEKESNAKERKRKRSQECERLRKKIQCNRSFLTLAGNLAEDSLNG